MNQYERGHPSAVEATTRGRTPLPGSHANTPRWCENERLIAKDLSIEMIGLRSEWGIYFLRLFMRIYRRGKIEETLS